MCDGKGLPGGTRLLDRLYDGVATADAAAAPLLRRLFLASWRPFAERLEAWLFGAVSERPTAAFMAAATADLRGLLPAASPAAAHWVSCRCFT